MAKYYYLARVKRVKKPRKDWPDRWAAAGKSVNWKGVYFKRDARGNVTGEMIAERESPIWKALSKGEGGFRDATGKGKPPFAFGSGMGWAAKPLNEKDSKKVQDIASIEKSEVESLVQDKVLQAVSEIRKSLPMSINLILQI